MLRSHIMKILMIFQILFLTVFIVLGGQTPVAHAAATKIMPLGDSITGNPGCWKALLWTRLQNSGYTNIDFVGTQPPQGCAIPYDGDSEGHGGILATNMADQTQLPPWLAATTPDIVIMHLGTNDVWSGKPTATILTAFTTLIGQMRASNPSMKIIVAQILPMNPSGCSFCYQGAIDLNAAIPAWAAGLTTAQSPITVVDQWTGFDTATDTGDGVHPNDLGNQKISDKWYPALSALLTVGGNTATVTRTNTPGTPAVTSTKSLTPTNTTCPAVSGYVRLGSTSGSGLAGVTVTGVSGSTTLTGTTDSTGMFVLGGCGVSGMVVTPSLTSYMFSPASQTFTGSALTFVATLFTTPTPSITPTRTRTPTVTNTGTGISPTPAITRTFTRTPTPTVGFTSTVTVTPTLGSGTCSPISATITAPFTYDGAGTFCWQSASLGGFINSWNLVSLTVNGVNYSNVYLASGSYPAKIGGYYYVSYNSTVAWGHFEAK